METPNFLALVNKIRELSGIRQVRFHQVLMPRFINMLGRNGIVIMCLVPSKVNPNKYVKITTLLKAAVVENEDMHNAIVQDIKNRVEDYTIRNIKPARFVNVNRPIN
jgi:hypothetical protein